MSFAAIRNPIATGDRPKFLIFHVTKVGDLGFIQFTLNDEIEDRQLDTSDTAPDQVMDRLNSLVSFTFRDTIRAYAVVNPKTATPSGQMIEYDIKLLSPVHRATDIKTNYTRLAGSASADGTEGWLYYIIGSIGETNLAIHKKAVGSDVGASDSTGKAVSSATVYHDANHAVTHLAACNAGKKHYLVYQVLNADRSNSLVVHDGEAGEEHTINEIEDVKGGTPLAMCGHEENSQAVVDIFYISNSGKIKNIRSSPGSLDAWSPRTISDDVLEEGSHLSATHSVEAKQNYLVYRKSDGRMMCKILNWGGNKI